MTWAKLLASNNVTRQPATKKELDNLRSIVSRSSKDVNAVDGRFAKPSAYFDGCRIKRNVCEYDFAGGLTDTDGLLKAVQQFAIDAETWIKARHPTLA